MIPGWRDKWDVDLEDGLPQDWGDPEEEYDPRPTLPTDILGRGRWRVLIITLTADEKRALVELAEHEQRHPATMAAMLVRFVLVEMGLVPRGNYGKHER